MKTLIILTAALVSGAAYGQYPDPAIQAYSDRMRGDFRSTQILEQLEELRAAQRQQQYEIYNRQLWEQNRIQPENYLRNLLEDCE